MAKILYFAQLAETLGLKTEQLALPEQCRTTADLIALLRSRGEPFSAGLGTEATVLIAVNQEMSDINTTISDTDEIAFFPPVTGG